MSRGTPKWGWYICAAATLVALGAWFIRGGAGEAPKPKTFMSIYGEPATYLDEQTMWITGQPTSYVIEMPVSSSADEEQRTKQADDLFAYYAGPHAEDLGFKRVVIRPDDGTRPGEVDIFGFKLTLRVSVGTGPVTDLGDGIVYDRHSDGVWFRGGFTPDAPVQVQEIAPPTGAKFALTYGIEDYPFGWFVYECLSCRPGDGSAVLAKNLIRYSEALGHQPSATT